MSATRVILASTSSWRADLLSRLQVPFGQVDPEVDEDPYKERGLPPRELVTELAIAKAQAVAARHPEALVIGADQVAFLGGRVLGKPGTVERAETQLGLLAGRTHELVTGTALIDGRTGDIHTAVDVHLMTMRALSRQQIASYIQREKPLDAAGSYYIEGLGIALFDGIDGSDFTAIIGLPLTQVVHLFTASGIDVLAPLE